MQEYSFEVRLVSLIARFLPLEERLGRAAPAVLGAPSVTNWDTAARWPKADLLFMRDALDHGMSCAKVAGFLGRTEEEIREKSKKQSRKTLRCL
jgi:hypothetical protein